ncbi:Cystathionine beta-synthase [Euzebya pacifica]|uniref:Cystathionine beta-synthase n=1 Tax=Euzebya pacifica TaxID=1608957 RepID=A0A346XVK9_9ACTN|nr:cystathionine beta-synthase [Euzebya pacifica]AXV06256.1 Cystathionine beta-synthase [Euzebya pacifica]
MDTVDSLLDVVGNTPLVKLSRFSADVAPTILAKVEYLNPGGSVKDRIGLAMIEAAEKSGDLQPGGTIVEPTSGNTGAGLAIAAAQRGYRCIFVMPDKMSAEKINLLRAYGAEVVVCPTDVDPEDPRSYYKTSDRLVEETPGAFKPGQYFNQANPQAHYVSTGPEIWEQTEGKIDVFVAGVGTGGTITGTGRYLKEQNPDIVIVGADPEGSIYTQPDNMHSYLTEGVGEDFWPGTFDPDIVDRWVKVTDRDAFLTARRLTREEGILVGGSCGTAAAAALEVAKDYPADAVIVTLLPDSGRNYLSKIYNDDWMHDHGFLRSGVAAKLSQVLEFKAGATTLPTIVHVHPHESVRDAIATLSSFGVSQMPVVTMPDHEQGAADFSDRADLVGSIRERGLLDRAFRDAEILDKTVADVMDEPLPVVDARDTVDTAMAALTKRASAVLVCEGTTPTGVLTRADILDFMTSSKGK